MSDDALASFLTASDVDIPDVHFLTGEVIDASVSPPLIQVGASDTAVPCPTLYQPVTGDFVIVLTAGASRICIGSTKPRGWQHIAAATFSGVANVDVTIPSSIYKMVRITLLALHNTTLTTLSARVNNDTTVNLHRYAYQRIQANATVTAAAADATEWLIGAANNGFNSKFEITLHNTDASSGLTFNALNTVFDTTAATARQQVTEGQLSTARLISSLRFLVGTGTISGSYVAEGYVVPS